MQINRESRSTIHAGVNFVVAPFPGVDRATFIRFQEQLAELSINISNAVYGEKEFVVVRQGQPPLEIKIATVGPQIGQLLIVAPGGVRSLESFAMEAQDVAEIFRRIWPQPNQIIASDVTIRDLYDTPTQHSFAELWEQRLHQSPEELRVFNRSILGGGIRFVLAQAGDNPPDPVIETKIESFLNDSRKLFLEVQIAWRRPMTLDDFDPTSKVESADNFIRNEVVRFIAEERR